MKARGQDAFETRFAEAATYLLEQRGRIAPQPFPRRAFLIGQAGECVRFADAGQVGIGSPTTGSDYTLMSITVVVLGGASVTGGRGSFISTLLGAALVQATSSASSYIDANSSVHYTVIGTLTLLAAIFFSLARRRAAGG